MLDGGGQHCRDIPLKLSHSDIFFTVIRDPIVIVTFVLM